MQKTLRVNFTKEVGLESEVSKELWDSYRQNNEETITETLSKNKYISTRSLRIKRNLNGHLVQSLIKG